VFNSGPSAGLEQDVQLPPHRRLRFRETVRGLQEQGQIVQVRCYIGVVRPEAPLFNPDRPPHQRLNLSETVGVLEKKGQVIEMDGDFGVIRSVTRLDDL
jgi:hypothetical protein